MSKKFIAVVTEECSCNYHELGGHMRFEFVMAVDIWIMVCGV
jgi:hypothetical protein